MIAGVDNDISCRETYVSNNDNTMLDCKPPEFLALDMFPASSDYLEGQQQEVWDHLNVLLPHYRRLAPEVPLLFAICAPCQSFTRFIQRRLSDDRATDRDRDRSLLSQTIGFIEEFKPDMIVSENVANIERGRYRHIWDEFRTQLSEWYDTGSKRVCASRFGVPQYRRRSILLGLRRLEEDAPTLFDLSVPSFDPAVPSHRSVKGAIEGLPALDAGEKHDTIANHQCRGLTDINWKRLKSVKPGESNSHLKDSEFGDLRLGCHRRLEENGKRGFGDVYTRMHPDRPSPTITTRFHSISNGRFGHYDAEQVRGISLREGATLQSFSRAVRILRQRDGLSRKDDWKRRYPLSCLRSWPSPYTYCGEIASMVRLSSRRIAW